MTAPDQGDSDATELQAFVTKAREALNYLNPETNGWINDTRSPVVDGVLIRRKSASDEPPVFTVAEVTQPVGAVIPPHRHNEGHVLLRVIQGAIQVDCEGYSRRIKKNYECLIPKGFTHTVFALRNEKGEDAVYLSAHYEDLLSVDNNRFLSEWPKQRSETDSKVMESIAEIHLVSRLTTWFLSLHPEYLNLSNPFKAWFYILHTSPDSDTPEVDQPGFAGDWSELSDHLDSVQNRTDAAEGFRLGVLLKQKEWSSFAVYHSLFVASIKADNARQISGFYATREDDQWCFKHPENSSVERFLNEDMWKIPFQEYMRLLTNDFLPGTEYIVYLTPPQCPGKHGYLDDVQRMPFSSLIVGLTHGDKDFIAALQSFFLLCSSVLQQFRFAVRADVVKIRYDEEHRLSFFKDKFLEELKKP